MWTEQRLDDLLATPSPRLIEDMAKIKGDILILGAGGKMGPTLCYLAKNACKAAGVEKKIIAVSRFTDEFAVKLLNDNGIETIPCDMLEPKALESLPDCENVIYMAGRKFGTNGQEYLTWAMNAYLPALVAERYKNSNIMAFSSGNVYPLVQSYTGGSVETDRLGPIGEYSMSCLARDRAFEYGSKTYGTKTFIYRLNLAVDLRYGILFDIANNVLNEEAISISSPAFNCIWQGDANEIAIRGLLHCESPMNVVNVTGPETFSVRYAAELFGKYFGKTPVYKGEEKGDSYLSNAGKAIQLFGYPTIGINDLIKIQAEWMQSGGRSLGKPTHFEERGGTF